MAAAPPKPGQDTGSISADDQALLDGVGTSQTINTLPVNQGTKTPGKVNFLGSSYSGTDITVIVHLYSEVTKDTQQQELQRKYEIAREISDAAGNLSNTDPTPFIAPTDPAVDRTAAVLFHAFGGDTPHIESKAQILNTYSAIQSFAINTPQKLTMFTAAFDQMFLEYQNQADAAHKQLQDYDNIRKASANTLTLGNLQSISMQSFREKNAVRGFGSSAVKGYVRGPRTIAGTMIFTVFDEHSLAKLMRAMASDTSVYGEGKDNNLAALLTDQLPPIDITIVFANEYGSLSSMSLYGVEFVSDSMVLSVQDLLTEQEVHFVAREIDPMISRGNIALDRKNRGQHFNSDGTADMTGTALLVANKDQYTAYLQRLGLQRRLSNR